MAIVRLYKKCIQDLDNLLAVAPDEVAQCLAADEVTYLLEDMAKQELPARAAYKKLVLEMKVCKQAVGHQPSTCYVPDDNTNRVYLCKQWPEQV